jgi:general secretion pathway protein C
MNVNTLQQHAATALSLLLLVACAYTLATVTWQLLAPPHSDSPAQPTEVRATTPPVRPQQTIAQLTSAHLFGSVEQIVASASNAPVTRLDLVLRGILAAGNPAYASAIIATGKTGNEEFYGIGDSLPGGAKLHQVHADHVVLDRGGQMEILHLTTDEPLDVGNSTIAASQDSPNADEGIPEEVSSLGDVRKLIIKNPTAFGDFALPVVVKEAGKQLGYRLQAQEKGREFLQQAGLLETDIITSIEDISLDNPQNGVLALRKLSAASSLNITVLRDGNEVPLTIQLQ